MDDRSKLFIIGVLVALIGGMAIPAVGPIALLGIPVGAACMFFALK